MGKRTRQRAIAIGATGVMLIGLAAPASAGFKSGSYSGETTQLDGAGDPYPLLLSVNQKYPKVDRVRRALTADWTGHLCIEHGRRSRPRRR